MPLRSSEWTSVKRDASSASCAAYAARPTRVAVKAPLPATTKLPDMIRSPGLLEHRVGLAGQQRLVDLQAVGLGDLTVHHALVAGAEFDQVPEHDLGGWPDSTATPSRRTVGRASPITARASRVLLARSSWTMPMRVFARITKPKRLSWNGPDDEDDQRRARR